MREVDFTAKNAKDTKTGGMFAELLWQVQSVPLGRVATYGDIAYAAGHPGAARQVAWALHSGRADLPWHRIVGAGGRILLTGEHALQQRIRLQAEGVGFLGLKVNMAKHRHSFFPQQYARKKKSARKPVKFSHPNSHLRQL